VNEVGSAARLLQWRDARWLCEAVDGGRDASKRLSARNSLAKRGRGEMCTPRRAV